MKSLLFYIAGKASEQNNGCCVLFTFHPNMNQFNGLTSDSAVFKYSEGGGNHNQNP